MTFALLHGLKTAIGRRRLKDPAYGFLFEPDTSGELVCFDCETSGLDPNTAELLSIGAVVIKGNRVLASRRLELIVRPERRIGADAIKINRLREMDVADGLPVREALDQFLRFIGSRPLVGYYLEFDVAMVNKYLRPWLGVGLPNRQTDVSALYYDSRVKSLGTHYNGNVDLRLGSILQALALPEREAHDAFNDALMTALVYVKLTEDAKPRD
ncbi:MAG: 3'-5' exonuclease [Caenispirillum bisanense]|nr:3'-5' exonuclease [Caenispirillum bisanense]MCA1974120.1 3'-5' exonuclease [Caenispirillum sp.]